MLRSLRYVAPLVGLLALTFAIPDADARRRRRAGGFGTLEINSMTDGAQVEIDGSKVGVLPFAKPLRVKVGKHTLKLTKKGYTEYLDVFTIKRRKTTSLDIDLLPYAGVVKIICNVEEARVFIDGKFVGTSPLEHEVLMGKRTIRVRKAGYLEHIGTFKSIAGKTKTVKITLKAMAVGTTPYRPPPPPPPKWYEKWYVWAGAAGGVVAVTLTVVISVVVANQSDLEDFSGSADHTYIAAPGGGAP